VRTRGIWCAVSAPRSPPTCPCRSANANDASNRARKRHEMSGDWNVMCTVYKPISPRVVIFTPCMMYYIRPMYARWTGLANSSRRMRQQCITGARPDFGWGEDTFLPLQDFVGHSCGESNQALFRRKLHSELS